MDKCESPNLFSPINTTHLLAVKRLFAFRDAYEPIHGYLCLPICTFGVITNVIHIFVLTSKSMRNSAVNIILAAIAFCDAGTMLSYIVYLIHFVLSPKDFCANEGAFLSHGWMVFLMFHISVSIALHTSSLWLAVTMAFLRLMTLRQGSLTSNWQKSIMAWRLSGIVYLAVILLCIPTIISHEIREFNRHAWHDMCQTNVSPIKYMNDTSYGVYTIGISWVALQNDCNLYKANLWLTGVIFKVLPCIFLLFLSSSLLLRISEAAKKRQRLLGNSVKRPPKQRLPQKMIAQKNGGGKVVTVSPAPPPAVKKRRRPGSDHTTKMLISILFVFLITEFPQGFIAILNAIYLRDVTKYVYQSLDDFMDLLSLLNASVNFILYCTMSTRYRQSFWKVILPRRAYVTLFLRGKRSRLGQQSDAATGTFFPAATIINPRIPEDSSPVLCLQQSPQSRRQQLPSITNKHSLTAVIPQQQQQQQLQRKGSTASSNHNGVVNRLPRNGTAASFDVTKEGKEEDIFTAVIEDDDDSVSSDSFSGSGEDDVEIFIGSNPYNDDRREEDDQQQETDSLMAKETDSHRQKSSVQFGPPRAGTKSSSGILSAWLERFQRNRSTLTNNNLNNNNVTSRSKQQFKTTSLKLPESSVTAGGALSPADERTQLLLLNVNGKFRSKSEYRKNVPMGYANGTRAGYHITPELECFQSFV